MGERTQGPCRISCAGHNPRPSVRSAPSRPRAGGAASVRQCAPQECGRVLVGHRGLRARPLPRPPAVGVPTCRACAHGTCIRGTGNAPCWRSLLARRDIALPTPLAVGRTSHVPRGTGPQRQSLTPRRRPRTVYHRTAVAPVVVDSPPDRTRPFKPGSSSRRRTSQSCTPPPPATPAARHAL